jgi:hypothetical protein
MSNSDCCAATPSDREGGAAAAATGGPLRVQRLRFLGSPTIRVGGVDVDPESEERDAPPTSPES